MKRNIVQRSKGVGRVFTARTRQQSFLIPVKSLKLEHFVLLCAISWQTSADGAQGTLTSVMDSRRPSQARSV